jgi:hypothetical protein
MGVGGYRHAPVALPAGKGPGTHFTGGWVGPRALSAENLAPHFSFSFPPFRSFSFLFSFTQSYCSCLFICTVQHIQHKTSMSQPVFEPAIPTSDRPQTYALDRAATRIGRSDPRTFQRVAIPTELSRPLWLTHVVNNILNNRRNKVVKNGKYTKVYFQSTCFRTNVYFSLKDIAVMAISCRRQQQNVFVFMQRSRYFCPIVSKYGFSR